MFKVTAAKEAKPGRYHVARLRDEVSARRRHRDAHASAAANCGSTRP